jgi:hypothetical protein
MIAQLCAMALIAYVMRFAPPPVHRGQVYYDLPLFAFYLGLGVPTLGLALVAAPSPAIARAVLVIALRCPARLQPGDFVIMFAGAQGIEIHNAVDAEYDGLSVDHELAVPLILRPRSRESRLSSRPRDWPYPFAVVSRSYLTSP